MTPIIAKFLKKRKARDPGLQEMISDLSLLAFERNQFIMKLEKLDKAFQQRLKDHQFLALEKAKEGMELVKMQMTELFKVEWEKLVYNFN